MSTFEIPVLAVDDVFDHPDADRLSVVRVRGYEAITMKNEDGSHRFEKGELIVYVPEGAVVPEHLLKQYGFWNDEKNIGMLAGSAGNRVKAIRLRGMLSQGLVWKCGRVNQHLWDGKSDFIDDSKNYAINGDEAVDIKENDNVAEFFGIVKYEEVIPASMSGNLFNCQEAKFDYDIENIKNFTQTFTAGQESVFKNDDAFFIANRDRFETVDEYPAATRVTVKDAFDYCFLQDDNIEITEKLHGTFCRMTWLGDQEPDPKLFGDGRVAITSKGLGAKGLVFQNTPENMAGNLYVRTLHMPFAGEADACLVDAFVEWCELTYPGQRVHLMGEIFGRGVQDLHYGLGTPGFRAFDVAVRATDGRTVFLGAFNKAKAFEAIGVERVPVLYTGLFDRAKIDELTSGTTLLGGFNIREGVVITAVGDQEKRAADKTHQLRPILKSVSEAYLLRKNGTELQ